MGPPRTEGRAVSGHLLLRAGSFKRLEPDAAGFRYLSLALLRMGRGQTEALGSDREELLAVVLRGALGAEVEGERWALDGRPDVFDGLPWALYLPAGARARVRATAEAEVAVVGARAEARGEPRVVTPDQVEVEVRGAGSATRQVNHILPPEFPAHRLLVVEVLTPGGNWSSYPPHKHDVHDPPREVELEEFYYFRVRPPEGFAFQRVYSPERGVDLAAAVRHGDVVLVPHGYHVSGAPHGIDLYYLNGLAGEVRSMAAADDPALAWIRGTWQGMERDPRVPMTGPAGGRRASDTRR
jgi:5-deoxy-glucuronate isomerase